MNSDRLPRKLAAILYADVAGYSRLTGEDEDATHRRLRDYLDLIAKTIESHHGQVMHYAGDAVLAKFDAVVDALSSAVSIQEELKNQNSDLPDERKVQFRIGINLGDVIEDRGDIYGDGVNVAARLESLADEGGVCISELVRTAIGNKLELNYESMGEQQVKNIAEPVNAYRVDFGKKATAPVTRVVKDMSNPGHRWWPVAIAVVLVVAGGAIWWQPWLPRADSVAVQTTPDIPRVASAIAVLPFDNMSSNSDLDYFSDGMTEDIITLLSQNPDLNVVSRNSSFTYKGQAVKARQVSEELGVRYVLEGSVRKQGDIVRITAQLIDAKTDTHIWAERFDEEGTDVFALQDRVTQKIDATLSGGKGRIRKAEYKRAWKMDAEKLEEYDYFLRGHSLFYGYTPEAMLKARDIWQEGLRKFPDSGLLRVKIGWTYFQFFFQGWTNEPEKELERAYQLAQEGLADLNLPPVGQWNGHWLNAFVQLFHKRDHDRALQEAITTLEIVPNDSDTLAFNAAIAVYAGKPELALKWVNRAISRQPHVPDWYYIHLGQAYHLQGDCSRAIEAFAKVPWPSLDKSALLVVCYLELGKLDDARAELAKLLEGRPGLTAANIEQELPYRDQDIFDRILVGLTKVGLPE